MISSIHLLQIFFGSIIFVVGKSPMDIMELILAFLQPTTVDKEPFFYICFKRSIRSEIGGWV